MLLIAAVFMDFSYDRIDNRWILFGILSGLVFRIQEGGWYGACSAVFPMIMSFALLYPIYKIGALGAGDVKLFMMSGSFFQMKQFFSVIIVSFMIAAFFSLLKMITRKNFKKRMQYLFSYLLMVAATGQWRLYEDHSGQEIPKEKSSKIHFALPVCISVMLELGGLF